MKIATGEASGPVGSHNDAGLQADRRRSISQGTWKARVASKDQVRNRHKPLRLLLLRRRYRDVQLTAKQDAD